MNETGTDRDAMARLARALTFIRSSDNPVVFALRQAPESGAGRDIHQAGQQPQAEAQTAERPWPPLRIRTDAGPDISGLPFRPDDREDAGSRSVALAASGGKPLFVATCSLPQSSRTPSWRAFSVRKIAMTTTFYANWRDVSRGCLALEKLCRRRGSRRCRSRRSCPGRRASRLQRQPPPRRWRWRSSTAAG